MRFLLAGALLLAACGDHVSAAASGATHALTVDPATPVPWTSAAPSFPPPATPTIAPVPTGVARCDPKTLRLADSSYQGAMGGLYGASFLVHDGTPCLVAGDFTVRFIDQRGQVVLTAPSPSTPYPLNPGWALAGRARITWGILWCDRNDPVVGVEVDYGGSTYRNTIRPLVGGAACDSGGASGVALRGNAFVTYPLGTQPTEAPSPPPPALRPSISAPLHVRAGDILTYVVSLANVSTTSVRLAPCPNYVEELMGRSLGTATPPIQLPAGKAWPGAPRYAGIAKEGHALNCEGAPEIAAGASVAFLMEIQAPADGEGQGTLRWELSDENAIQASATVLIDPR